MLAFLFGFFIFLFVGVGIVKLFGARNTGKAIFIIISKFVVTALGLVVLFKLLMYADSHKDEVGVIVMLAIALFVIVAILAIIGVVLKVFGVKSTAKFALFSIGVIALIIIAILVVVFAGAAIINL